MYWKCGSTLARCSELGDPRRRRGTRGRRLVGGCRARRPSPAPKTPTLTPLTVKNFEGVTQAGGLPGRLRRCSSLRNGGPPAPRAPERQTAVVEPVVANDVVSRPDVASTLIQGMAAKRAEFGGEARCRHPPAGRPGLGSAVKSSSNSVARKVPPPTVCARPLEVASSGGPSGRSWPKAVQPDQPRIGSARLAALAEDEQDASLTLPRLGDPEQEGERRREVDRPADTWPFGIPCRRPGTSPHVDVRGHGLDGRDVAVLAERLARVRRVSWASRVELVGRVRRTRSRRRLVGRAMSGVEVGPVRDVLAPRLRGTGGRSSSSLRADRRGVQLRVGEAGGSP